MVEAPWRGRFGFGGAASAMSRSSSAVGGVAGEQRALHDPIAFTIVVNDNDEILSKHPARRLTSHTLADKS